MPTKTAGKGLQRVTSRVRYVKNPDKPRPREHAAKGARPCCAASEKTRGAHKNLFIYESWFCLLTILMDSQVSKSMVLNTVPCFACSAQALHLSLSHSHTHTHSLSLSLSHTHTHTLSLSLSLTHTHTHTLSLSHTHTHTLSLSLSLSLSHTLSLSLSLTHTLSLSLSLTHTHTLSLIQIVRSAPTVPIIHLFSHNYEKPYTWTCVQLLCCIKALIRIKPYIKS